MTEPVTDAEVLFLALLDEWCVVFPDGEHVDSQLREVYLPRAISHMTRPQLAKAIVRASNVIVDFTKLVDIALEGAVRESWMDCMKDIVDEFKIILDTLYTSYDRTLH